MDEKSLEMLEFPQIREILAGFTSFSVSRGLAFQLQPLVQYEKILLLLKQSTEARHLLDAEPHFSIGAVTDVRDEVGKAAKGKILEPQKLLETQQVLSATRDLRSNLSRSSAEVPLLWNIASNIAELRPLEKDIGNCLLPTGELLDSASAALAGIRDRLRQVRTQLLGRLEAIMKSPRGHKIVQEPVITEREGRYVIPVKMESRKELKGIVHDVSNTGVTVFVEPWATVEMGNELRELVLEEKREIDKILARLSAQVGAYENEICRNIELAAELDIALAKARYARKARAIEPALTASGDGSEKNILKLVEARHPLLGEKAVPLTVEIGRDFSVLVITGPNTGGKTVALKTIGLLSLMAQAGMPIPAAPESQLPVFDNIFADIGDEQSIAQTLSTNRWHVGNIKRIISGSTRRSLVLLDELGTSTDPAEGSALARAILRYFLERGNLTVATTHFNDLKAFAHTTPGMQNASLEFDPVTLTPTYHLTVGIPGGSNALATASRLGLPQEIIADARGLVARGNEELQSLLASLMSERQKIVTLRQALEKEKAEAERRNTELKDELQRLRSSERRILQEARDKISLEAAGLHKEIRQVTSELRKEKTRERIEQSKKALAVVRGQLKSETWQTKTEGETPEESAIAAGDTVRLKEANVEATVISVDEETQEVDVQAGHTRLRLGLDSVEKIVPSGKAVPVYSPVKKLSRRIVPPELDLRGKRADEVEPLLDSYLNDASLASLSEARIIHGIGTGIVRKIVREMLANHPLVKSFRPGERGEGGDGVTIVRL